MEAVSQSGWSALSVISSEGRNLKFRGLEESRFLGCRLEMTLRHSFMREGLGEGEEGTRLEEIDHKNGLTNNWEKVIYKSFRTRKYGVRVFDKGVCPSKWGETFFFT
jgi:hypothetical protein